MKTVDASAFLPLAKINKISQKVLLKRNIFLTFAIVLTEIPK